MNTFYNVGYPLGNLEVFPLKMLLLAMLVILPPTVLSTPCGPADKTKCGCPLASLTISNTTRKLGWLPSENNTHVDKGPGQYFDTIIASDAGASAYILWPGGIAFYVIDSAFSSDYQTLIRKAIAEAQAAIGVNHVEFVEAKSSSGTICRKHYIHLEPTKDVACLAHIGVQLSGLTIIRLNENYCKYVYAVIHELLHAIGRDHEHTRKDRDTHLQINYGNILTTACQAFQKPAVFDATGSLDYDYESVMHYASCSGSCNGGYVYTKKDGSPIGINDKLSVLDVKKIRHMYPAEQKVSYIAKRLCRGPGDKIETVEELGKKLKKNRKGGTGGEDLDDYHSGGHKISIFGPLILLMVSMGMLSNSFFVPPLN